MLGKKRRGVERRAFQPLQHLFVLRAQLRDAPLESALESGRRDVGTSGASRRRVRARSVLLERGDAAREPARAPACGRGVGHQDDHRHGHQRQRERRASRDGPARRRRAVFVPSPRASRVRRARALLGELGVAERKPLEVFPHAPLLARHALPERLVRAALAAQVRLQRARRARERIHGDRDVGSAVRGRLAAHAPREQPAARPATAASCVRRERWGEEGQGTGRETHTRQGGRDPRRRRLFRGHPHEK